MSDTSSSGTPVDTLNRRSQVSVQELEASSIEKINLQELIKNASLEDSQKEEKKTIEVVIHHHHHYHKNPETSHSSVRKSSIPKSSPSRSFSASPQVLSNSNSINTTHQSTHSRNNGTFKAPSLGKLSTNKHFNSSNNSTYVALRNLSLQNLNAAQHFLLAIGRDISFIVPILGLINSIKKAWDLNMNTLQKYPDVEYMPNFYKTMFYIQQQDTKNLYLFWQNLFNSQIESYQNNTINLLQNWKHFIAYLNLTDTSFLNTAHGNTTNSSDASKYLQNTTNASISSFIQTKNGNNASSVSSNLNYQGSPSKSSTDIRPSYLSAIITGRSSEFLMCGLWCIVSMYLTYVTLDALMVRWITIYSTTAAILRMFSISLLLIIIELFILKTLSNEPTVTNNKNFKFGGENSLHAWIFISCVLTFVYIWQSFWTSFLQQQKRKDKIVYEEEQRSNDRIDSENESIIKPFTTTLQFWKYTLRKHLDLYSIIVFAVVPVGVASFLTMIVLLRNLVIQRMDVEQLEKVWYEINKEFMI
ncbi:hypothetical protein QEN19_004344 [Hanseniaspora menglaensis]